MFAFPPASLPYLDRLYSSRALVDEKGAKYLAASMRELSSNS